MWPSNGTVAFLMIFVFIALLQSHNSLNSCSYFGWLPSLLHFWQTFVVVLVSLIFSFLRLFLTSHTMQIVGLVLVSFNEETLDSQFIIGCYNCWCVS